jgi:hypothetical protein
MNTRYWSFVVQDADEYDTKIIVLHYRQNDKKFPYMLFFHEHVGVDHWFGGRRRFGQDHGFKSGTYYFDSDGSGEFIAGEHMDWIPHYMFSGNPNRIGLCHLMMILKMR